MNSLDTLRRPLGVLILGCLCVSVCSCRRAEPASPVVAEAAQTAPEVVNAFAEASAGLKDEAQAAAEALTAQADEDAFVRLEVLSGREELTPDQRRAVSEAWMAANLRLQAAASNGNSSAQAALNDYRARK